MKVKHFKNREAFRAWLVKNHARERELWVGYYKKDSGRASITWPESVDEALCYGWIDGLRKNVDEISYKIRFTPRRPGSIWSAVNTRRANALIESGAMQAAGLAAFKLRKANRSGIYTYEQRSPVLDDKYAKLIRRDRAAWKFYEAQTPGYRKLMNWWVVSAKLEATRLARSQKLIAYCANGERLPQWSPTTKSGGRGTTSREREKKKPR
jgi:uncharacterized protein YdeI (YjbR/CyaY-like superfamily)